MPVKTGPVPIDDPAIVRSIVQASPDYRTHQDELVRRIVLSECLLRGHWQLQSGAHSDVFLRFRSFVRDWDNAVWAASRLAETFRRLAWHPTAIVAPETAGSLLALALNDAEFAERDRVFLVKADSTNHPLDYFLTDAVGPRESVLIVNDIVTTGRGIQQLVDVSRERGAEPIGVVVFASRDADADLGGLRSSWIADVKAEQWDPTVCPICEKEGTTDLFYAKEFN